MGELLGAMARQLPGCGSTISLRENQNKPQRNSNSSNKPAIAPSYPAKACPHSPRPDRECARFRLRFEANEALMSIIRMVLTGPSGQHAGIVRRVASRMNEGADDEESSHCDHPDGRGQAARTACEARS